MINSLISIVAADTCQKGGDFFGLVPWYHYMKASSFDKCEIVSFNILPGVGAKGEPSDIPLVLLAVTDDLLRIAGLVAIAFIIVGAVQYIKGQGSAEDSARAQSTIVNALIGLAISITAVAFVSFLGAKIGG
ncbi:MAG: hypothetical protein AAB436_01185 [Patescibacteria group bacterium]